MRKASLAIISFLAACSLCAQPALSQIRELPKNGSPTDGNPCTNAPPPGGIYLKDNLDRKAYRPALYRTQDGTLYDAFVSNLFQRSNAVVTKSTEPQWTAWIANPIRGCLWTYQLSGIPPVMPSTPRGEWVPSVTMSEISPKHPSR